MAKAIRGTIGASGNITINFQGADTVIPVTRGTNGIYDTPLPSALNTTMAQGGVCTVSDGTTTLSINIPGPTVGSVGIAPPNYTGDSTLPSIPPEDNGDPFAINDYGNGNIEFQWKAPQTLSAPDIYEVVLDTIIIFRAVANSHLQNPISVGNHDVSIRVVRNDGSFGPPATRNFNVS